MLLYRRTLVSCRSGHIHGYGHCINIFICLTLLTQSYVSDALIKSEMCPLISFKMQKRTIIKTDNSIANGATVIQVLHSSSFKSCLRSCCHNQQCTVAVFEITNKNLCYLFNCGTDASLCEFEEHIHFSTGTKVPLKGSPNSKMSKVFSPDSSGEQHEGPNVSDNDVQQGSKYLRTDSLSSDQSRALESSSKVIVTTTTNHRASVTSTAATVNVASVVGKSFAGAIFSKQLGFVHTSDLAERFRQTQSAIIGLAIGLALTLLTIIVLSCRLRQLHARIAAGSGIVGINGKLHGRAVDDEDYLINGMYL